MSLVLYLDGSRADSLPENVVVNVSRIATFIAPQDWSIDTGIRTLVIKELGNRKIDFANGMTAMYTDKINISIYNIHGLRKIVFDNDVKLTGSLYHFFQYCPDLERIEGDLDFSDVPNWTYANWFLSSSKLSYIRCVPNSAMAIGVLAFINLNNIDDECLISLANCCYENPDNSRTIQLHASKKTRCQQIMGDSVDQGDYHLFVQNENGTMTLQNFITNVKGWTIA